MLEVPQTFDLRLARSLIKLKLLQECTCNAATIEPRRIYLPGDNERRFASREALRSFLRTNDSCNTQSHVSEGVTCARARLLVGVRLFLHLLVSVRRKGEEERKREGASLQRAPR